MDDSYMYIAKWKNPVYTLMTPFIWHSEKGKTDLEKDYEVGGSIWYITDEMVGWHHRLDGREFE